MMGKFSIILLLAVILVPAMIGYVSKAKEVQSRAESYQTDVEANIDDYYYE